VIPVHIADRTNADIREFQKLAEPSDALVSDTDHSDYDLIACGSSPEPACSRRKERPPCHHH
jgi:hypothetical protein